MSRRKFIKTNDGHIFKITSNKDVYLKVSPYSINEDRRVDYKVLLEKLTIMKHHFLIRIKHLKK